MSILFFVCGGMVAISSSIAYDLYKQNESLTKKIDKLERKNEKNDLRSKFKSK